MARTACWRSRRALALAVTFNLRRFTKKRPPPFFLAVCVFGSTILAVPGTPLLICGAPANETIVSASLLALRGGPDAPAGVFCGVDGFRLGGRGWRAARGLARARGSARDPGARETRRVGPGQRRCGSRERGGRGDWRRYDAAVSGPVVANLPLALLLCPASSWGT